MAAWDATLPALNHTQGYEEQLGEATIRTSMETGADKTRTSPTAKPDTIPFEQILTTAQVATFKTFFRTTTKGGALAFTSTHPQEQVSKSFRFVGAPRIRHLGGSLYLSSFQLEVLP